MNILKIFYITKGDTIIFDPEFNEPLDLELTSQYKKIIFSNYVLTGNMFEVDKENNFKNLICQKSKFNQYVNDIHVSINHLTFGFAFNQEVDLLPQTITHLIFGTCFNRKVDLLPQKIKHLTFGYAFNQPVNMLPQTLTHLTFGLCFNQPIKNLPQTITHLNIGFCYNKNVDLPFGILYLKFDSNNKNIIEHLPNSIEELELSLFFNLELNNLPNSIKKIKFSKSSKYNKELNCLPKFVESIQLPKYYDKRILNIPSRLKKIICSKNYKFINDFDSYNVESYN
jgi:hypothetical protein